MARNHLLAQCQKMSQLCGNVWTVTGSPFGTQTGSRACGKCKLISSPSRARHRFQTKTGSARNRHAGPLCFRSWFRNSGWTPIVCACPTWIPERSRGGASVHTPARTSVGCRFAPRQPKPPTAAGWEVSVVYVMRHQSRTAMIQTKITTVCRPGASSGPCRPAAGRARLYDRGDR